MIAINKSEANAIRERFPHVFIVRTMKQKSKRGHYFCEEIPRVMQYLDKIRNENVIEQHGVFPGKKKGDGRNANRAKNNRVRA